MRWVEIGFAVIFSALLFVVIGLLITLWISSLPLWVKIGMSVGLVLMICAMAIGLYMVIDDILRGW